MSADEQDNADDKKMPLIDHLIELRQRLIYSLLAFFAAFAVCYFFSNEIFDFLARPLAAVWHGQEGRRLIFTALQEKFFTNVKVAMFGAAFVAFPLVANQLWMFVAPGLYKHEKGAFLPFLIATPFMFVVGAAFVYFGVIPTAWRFFAGFEEGAQNGSLPIQLEPKVNEYLSLVMHLILGFGFVFELPVLLTLLVSAEIIEAATLARQRRYAVVAAFLVAAILTPPDPLSMMTMAVPLVALYEISIQIGRLIEHRRGRRRAAEEAAAKGSAVVP
jgi:sec-independent protein translocase protein TatC